MKKIDHKAALQQSIMLLELKQSSDEFLLKEQFMLTYESLKPVNMIKNILADFTNQSDFKENIVDTSLSLVTGYLSKKVIFGSSQNPIKQIFGSLIQAGITNLIMNNSANIKAFATRLISNFSDRKD